MSKFYVYYLIDPRTNLPFYVGKGTRARFKDHFESSQKGVNPFKDHVIEKIRGLGLEPLVEILQNDLTENQAFELETLEIKQFGRRDNGTGILVNLSDGGEGQSGYRHTDATKEILSVMAKEGRIGFRGRHHSEKSKALIGSYHKGKQISDEQRKKISEGLKGRSLPKESYEKTVAKRRERYATWHTPETIAKFSASLTGRKLSEEHKRRVGDALRGRKDSAETRERKKAAKKEWWNNPERREKARQRMIEYNKSRKKSQD